MHYRPRPHIYVSIMQGSCTYACDISALPGDSQKYRPLLLHYVKTCDVSYKAIFKNIDSSRAMNVNSTVDSQNKIITLHRVGWVITSFGVAVYILQRTPT